MADHDPRWPEGPGEIRRGVRASLLLEACALNRGVSTVRVAPNAFASMTGAPVTLGFHNTVSLETSRAAERICDDRVMRKVLLSEHGVPVPSSAMFGFDDAERAVSYAAQLSGPVLLKPRTRVRGTPEQVRADGDVDQAISNLRTRVSSSSAFLAEERVAGPEYSFLVVGGEVTSVIRRQRGSWYEEVYADGTGDVHPDVVDIAVRAVDALPSVPHGSVRMNCPQVAAGADGCAVVSLRPAIGLIGRRPPQQWSVNVADTIVTHAARDSGPVTGANGRVAVAFAMSEVSDCAMVGQRLEDWIADAGLQGSVVTSADRRVTGHLTGPPGTVALLSGLAVTGQLGGPAPQTVSLELQEGPS